MAELMEIRRRMLAAADPTLPPVYRRVDYLVSAGQGAHIDTGVSGNDDTLSFELVCYAEQQYNYAGFMGNYVNSSTKAWRVILGASATTMHANAHRPSAMTLTPRGGTTVGTKLTVRLDSNGSSVTDGSGTYTAAASGASGDENSLSIALGRFAVLPTISGVGTYRNRFYGCRIWRGGQLIREYIPCVRAADLTAGFWERVNKTFNPSISQYAFGYGNDE